jgi:hypothetical protein
MLDATEVAIALCVDAYPSYRHGFGRGLVANLGYSIASLFL